MVEQCGEQRNSEKVLVEECWWNSGTVMVERTVWWNSGTVMVEQCCRTVEQCWRNSGTLVVEE